MSEHHDTIAAIVAEFEGGSIAESAREKLRRSQAAILDARWDAKLDGLRATAPFHALSEQNQKRALVRLAQLNRSQRKRGLNGSVPLSLPMSSCQPGWKQVATLGSNGFAFGSNDSPLVVPAAGNGQQFNMTGNSIVVATFPASSAIGIGAACGGWCDLDWEPGSTPTPSPLLSGNRAAGSLTSMIKTAPLGQVAPNALMVSCGVQLQSPFIGLCAGNPNEDSWVWACGQATLSVFAAGKSVAKPGWESKNASDTQTLFMEGGASQYDKNFSNIFGEPWLTNVYGLSDLTQPIGMSVTIAQPPPGAIFVYVNVAVEVSAWVASSRESLVGVDSTGANTGLPILTAPDFLYPYPTTAGGTGPAIVTGLRACGI